MGDTHTAPRQDDGFFEDLYPWASFCPLQRQVGHIWHGQLMMVT